MLRTVTITFTLLLFSLSILSQPVALHPENPHYFIYKGKPLVLVTSAEHYGAVLNLDFDFEKYLRTMHAEGMNYTRIFTGSYVEIPGSFNIGNNTLAPAVGSFITPWQRVNEPGLYKGENKFDLNSWNPAYFDRLKRFMTLAQELDIIVEVTLFCSTYTDASWERHPFNPGNNINNLTVGLNRKKSNTPESGNLFGYQKKLVEKLVSELNVFDNMFFEIQNEPWADDPQKAMRLLRTLDPDPAQGGWFKWAEEASAASLAWQKEMAAVAVETERHLPKKHLIAQNYSNFKTSLKEVDPNISILNFHYVWPEAVMLNYGWNRPVSFDESGFAGSSDTTYLRQAWQFMLAGGAVFNNLDYSFYVGNEDGKGVNKAPGGGSTQLRRQLVILRKFIESFQFVKMSPDFNVVQHAPGTEWQAISEPGKQYAVVFAGEGAESVRLNLPEGRFNYTFISPFTGQKLKSGYFDHSGNGFKDLALPEWNELVCLKITL